MSVQTISEGNLGVTIPLLSTAAINLEAAAGFSKSDILFQASAFAEVSAAASVELPQVSADAFLEAQANILLTPPQINVDVGASLGLDADLGSINAWLDVAAQINGILAKAGVKASVFVGTSSQWSAEASQVLTSGTGSDRIVNIVLSVNGSVNPSTVAALGTTFGTNIGI